MPRGKRITIILNEKQKEFLNAFCAKYGIANRSKFCREAIIRTALSKLDQDQPTLWKDI
jgi:metal-responsive CopG/Arc/MetJ family transcriptional regulator